MFVNHLIDWEGVKVNVVATIFMSSDRGAESFCFIDEKEAFIYIYI